MKTNKLANRILSLALSICMVLSLLPGMPLLVSAAGGLTTTVIDGETYYQISTADDLYAFAALVNGGEKTANAVLTADIDMTGTDWTPICSTALYYSSTYSGGEYPDAGYAGTFDGNGYVIKNLSVTAIADETWTYGLFGTMTGTVKNLGIEGFTYNHNGASDMRTGAIVGQNLGGTIENCYVVGATIAPGTNVAGGITGCNYAGKIKNCYVADSNIVASSSRYGYIAGDNRADTEGDRVGTIENCYTDGGLLVGTYTGIQTNCAVKLDKQFASGEVAYLLGSAWGQGTLPVLRGGETVYENTCGGDAFYSTTDGDFAAHNIGADYCCTNCGNYDPATLVTAENCGDLGLDESYAGYYAIENASNLYWYSERERIGEIGGSIVLLNDITLNNSKAEWIPLGWDGDCIFDGRGNTVTLKLDYGTEQDTANYGLFGTCNYSVIKNLVLDGDITVNTTGNVGAVAASMYRTTISGVVSYVNVTNTCTTAGNAGGLAGYFGGRHDATNNQYSKIENCAVYANVTGYNAGGLVGQGWNGTQYWDITNAAYVGNVEGTNAGAIIGYQATDTGTSTFTNIYWCEEGGLGFYGLRDTENQVYTNTSAKTSEQFASGEVAYLLGEGWGQTIGTDSYPLLGGAKVYIGYTHCDVLGYTNTADTTPGDHSYTDGVCGACGHICQHTELSGSVCVACKLSFAAKVNGTCYTSFDDAVLAANALVDAGAEDVELVILADTTVTKHTTVSDNITIKVDQGVTLTLENMLWSYGDFESQGTVTGSSGLDCNTVSGGTYYCSVSGTVTDGTFYGSVYGDITGGTFYGYVNANNITGGTFHSDVSISSSSAMTVSGATFLGNIALYGGDVSFSSDVTVSGYVEDSSNTAVSYDGVAHTHTPGEVTRVDMADTRSQHKVRTQCTTCPFTFYSVVREDHSYVNGVCVCTRLERYGVYVNGVEVDYFNAADVLGDGKVSYDAAANTLTLNGVSITGGVFLEGGGVNTGIASDGDLNLVLNGDNTVTSEDCEEVSAGMYIVGNLTVSGTGTLTVDCGQAPLAVSILASDLTVEEGANVVCKKTAYITGTVTAPGRFHAIAVKNIPSVTYEIYGNVTLSQDFDFTTADEAVTYSLTVMEGATLTVADGAKLIANKSNSVITNNGTIVLQGSGTVANGGTGVCLADGSNHLWVDLVCLVCHKQCPHIMVDASCTEPKHCPACGETVGEKLGHDWLDATCIAPKTCERCGDTEGEKLEHVMDSATGLCANGCKQLMAVASATVAGQTVCYETLDAAIQAVKDCTADSAAKVTLLQSIPLGNSYQTIASGVFTLDLNGFELSSTSTSSYGLLYMKGDSNMAVTLADSGTTGKINAGNRGIYVANGTLTVLGGTIIAKNDAIQTWGKAVHILGGTLQGGYYDFYPVTGENILEVGADGVGATFPGGILIGGSKALKDLLAEGAAYWAGDTMIVPFDDAQEISGKGDITVKAACDHSTGTKSFVDQGQYHFEHWSCCNADIRQDHAVDQAAGKCFVCQGIASVQVTAGGSKTYYATLAEAIAAVETCTQQDEAEVKLLRDIDLENSFQYIESGVFTLDLNGFTLSTRDDRGPLWLTGDSSTTDVTIVDSGTTGKIAGTDRSILVYGAKLTITGGTISSTNGSSVHHAVNAEDNSEILITGGTFISDGYALVAYGSTVTITGGTFTGSSYYAAVDVSRNTLLNITGGSFSSPESKAVDVSNAEATIAGGTFTGKTALSLYRAEMTVTGGTFSGECGADVRTDSVIRINGGTFDCDTDLETDSSTAIFSAKETGVGATFAGGIQAEGDLALNDVIATGVRYWAGETLLTVEDGAMAITDQGDILVKAICDHAGNENTEDGICDTAFTCSVCGFVLTEAKPHAFVYQIGEDGTHTGTCSLCDTVVTESHSYNELVCACGLASEEAVAVLWKNGSPVAGYATLDAAFEGAEDALRRDTTVLKLLQSVDLESSYQYINYGIFTLDLNGMTLTSGSSTGTLYISSYGDLALTITDTAGGGKIVNTSTWGRGICVSSGTVNIDSGTVERIDVNGGTLNICENAVISGGDYGVKVNDGTVNITGGSVSNTSTSRNYGAVQLQGGQVNITGGSISGRVNDIYFNESDATVVLGAGEDGVGATFPGGITVSGGTLNALLASGAGYWQNGSQLTVANDATQITGGDVTVKGCSNHVDADSNGRCDNCGALMYDAKLCFASVSLKGSIAINYYMLLSDKVIADTTAYMQFTMADGEIVQIPVGDGVPTEYNGETYYKFTCAVAAKEMTDVVRSQFFYKGGSTKEFCYTVKTYADYIIANSADADEVALAKAMLHYGAAAQLDFEYNTTHLANADLDAPDYSGVNIAGFATGAGQGTELASFYSASLLLKSETTLRFFFTGPITATYGGQALEVKLRGGRYYVDVVGIAAKDLDENVTITINDGTNTADVTYNPMAYCTVVQNDTTGTADQAMKDLVAALYLYNQAANTYFEEN